MQIPFVGGAYTARSPNLNAQRSVCWFPVIDQEDAKSIIAMYGTPGCKLFAEIEAAVMSFYPLAQSSDYVKATSYTAGDGSPPDLTHIQYNATNPDNPLTGTDSGNSWISELLRTTNQRFHIDCGSLKIVTRLYYENLHNLGLRTDWGAKTFTVWGSNVPGAFSTLTYAVDTDWTQIPTSQATFDQHVASNVADPKYITLTNTTAYRYYAIKIADNWGNGNAMGLRRIELQTTYTGSIARAVYPFGEVVYVVMGDRIYSVNSAGTATFLGTITTATGNIFMADNGTQILIVDGTFNGYYIEGGVLTAIVDADFPTATSCTFQDGYFIVTVADTGQIWISALYDVTSWDALDFATAEGSPDNALAVSSNAHDLWIFGELSAEVFYNSGNADFPFERIQGAFLEVGTGAAASVCKIEGIFYWLTEKRQVVRNVGYQFEAVSTEHIEYAIAQYTTISDARSWSYTLEGHIFYVLTFPTEDKTWVYDVKTKFWHEWQSYSIAQESVPYARHRGNCACWYNGKTIVGDYENGRLYELDMGTFTDNLEYIRRVRAAQTINRERYNVVHDELEIEFEMGVGLITGQGSDPQAMLDWSDDGGHTWSSEAWESLGLTVGGIGEFSRRARWQRLGISRNRVYRVTVTDPVKCAIIAAYLRVRDAYL